MIKSLHLKLMLIVFAFVLLSAVVWIVRVNVVESSAVETRLDGRMHTLVVKSEAYFKKEIESRPALVLSTLVATCR